nr:aminoglycoside phosphotransferase family protein [Kribbella sandramycini]
MELELARQLAGGPVVPPLSDVVHERDGFAITLWKYYETSTQQAIAPAEYADALARLHAAMRAADVPAPHVRDRVREAEAKLMDRALTPEVSDADRALLLTTLRERSAAIAGPTQLLHGEPHPGNLLATPEGPLFIDLETMCHGPVEFDLAHAPAPVAAHYPDADLAVLHDSRLLMLAMVITWRWEVGDQLPNGMTLAAEWTADLRTATTH